ncbi:hypothetical protein ACQPYK_38330 [Streptosporangium sp. CA-135522]|uniref:hypothetical protein n=1 Tax=Streptosporangium sp. CA-135522 TaxID=3240072 RepID=UPI003D948372
MTAFVVLVSALLLSRALGVTRLATWRGGTAHAMAIMPPVTASAHLALLYLLLLPANVYAVVADVPYNGGEVTPLWLRVPLQGLCVAVTLWISMKDAHVSQQHPVRLGGGA